MPDCDGPAVAKLGAGSTLAEAEDAGRSSAKTVYGGLLDVVSGMTDAEVHLFCNPPKESSDEVGSWRVLDVVSHMTIAEVQAAICVLSEAGLCNTCAALPALQVTVGQPAFTEVSRSLNATRLPAAELATSAATAGDEAQPGWDEALGVRCPDC